MTRQRTKLADFLTARRTPWLVLVALVAGACRDPTQVTLQLWTDVPCDAAGFHDAAIFAGEASLGNDSPSTTTLSCLPVAPSPSQGRLVLVPSGSKSARIPVQVVAGVGIDASQCPAPSYVLGPEAAASGNGCIVARRSLAFIPHTPLNLPIGLRRSCLNVDCPEGTTCANGACVSAEVDLEACEALGTCPDIDGTGGEGGGGGAGGGPPLVRAVAVSNTYSCAVRDDGTWCWGSNPAGAWGTGTSSSAAVVPTAAMIGVEAAELAAGLEHLCARTSGGEVWCAGHNDALQLGVMSPDEASPNLVPLAMPATSLGAGAHHTCASHGSGTTCWGQNLHGQVTLPPSAGELPVVNPQLLLSQVSGGAAHGCGLAMNGSVFCWGSNQSLQSGGSMVAAALSPTVANDGQGAAIQASLVAAGRQHSCAVTQVGQLLCWGTEVAASQQLGDGSKQTSVSVGQPVLVPGAVSALAVGDDASCAVSSGQVHCWGAFTSVGPAEGVTTPDGGPAVEPVPIEGLPPISAVAVAAGHACALSTSGEVYCWGFDIMGQVRGTAGSASGTWVYPPVLVSW